MANNTPLAYLLRPKTLTHFFGQTHLLKENSALRRAILQKKAHSMILWGPPGSGKTTIAHIISQGENINFVEISAVSEGIKSIRDAVQLAKNSNIMHGFLVLFVDEIHRFNRTQQDALLPHVESGLITLIGATTENPSFALTRSLLSRLSVYKLNPLSEEAQIQILERTLNYLNSNTDAEIKFTQEAKQYLVVNSHGDARYLMNYMESISQCDEKNIDEIKLKKILHNKPPSFDKHGDIFYQQLSAFHKSVRGSAPDAALYWFVRMIEAGCDAKVIARRLLAIASEDIGNADPRALGICLNAWDIYHRVGDKEGYRAIAQAIIYCALAAKSNAVYLAFKAALKDAKASAYMHVPKHLCNMTDELSKKYGLSSGYRYAHDEPHAYTKGQKYFPSALGERCYYKPTDRGLEAKISERLEKYRGWDRDAHEKAKMQKTATEKDKNPKIK